MIKKILVYWRDIPSYVLMQNGRTKGKAMLSRRFQEAIDRAAMRACKISDDAYMTEWRRVASSYEGSGDLQLIAQQQAAQIETDYCDEKLTQLTKNHGVFAG